VIVGAEEDDVVDVVVGDELQQFVALGPVAAIHDLPPSLMEVLKVLGVLLAPLVIVNDPPMGPIWSMGEEMATIFQRMPCCWAASSDCSNHCNSVAPSIVRLGLSARTPLSSPLALRRRMSR